MLGQKIYKSTKVTEDFSVSIFGLFLRTGSVRVGDDDMFGLCVFLAWYPDVTGG